MSKGHAQYNKESEWTLFFQWNQSEWDIGIQENTTVFFIIFIRARYIDRHYCLAFCEFKNFFFGLALAFSSDASSGKQMSDIYANKIL